LSISRIIPILIFCLPLILTADEHNVWQPDNGDGTYTNPIIFADYSDPDVIRVGDDFFLTASSFNCVPGLPILHSKDLVNWTIINHAIQYFDDPAFDIPQHGNGVWAPSIRFHDGKYYIYWGDPDRGIFMVNTDDPYKEWSKPVLVKKAYGNIDACPLWDDDGKVYLVHAFAHSRAGVNSLLQINELNAEGTGIVDKGTIVFDGHKSYPTIEGPKLYKRNGYYYIFAPAGGVATGWQTVLRSKSIYGPYEDKIVLEQGSTEINGPHQGGWVTLESGEDWFIHFQEKQPYGRIVHLNPVHWADDWPSMGVDYDGKGIGEPVTTYKKPDVGKTYPLQVPQTSDEFDSEKLGLQWQWQANYKEGWYSLKSHPGYLRLYPVYYALENKNKWWMPNILLQKFPAEKFTSTVKFNLNFRDNEKSALIIMGLDYALIQVAKSDGKIKISQIECSNAEKEGSEKINGSVLESDGEIILRVLVEKGGVCRFSYSKNGKTFSEIGKPFQAREGKWIGAKIGILSFSNQKGNQNSYTDVDWFRIQ